MADDLTSQDRQWIEIGIRGKDVKVAVISLIVSFIFLAASAMAETPPANPSVNPMKTLKIRWQRLVIKGETCPRCGATEKEMEKALQTLEQSLAPLGVRVALEKQELNTIEFQKDPLQSNRIWIEGRSLEEWLVLRVGQSPCCKPVATQGAGR